MSMSKEHLQSQQVNHGQSSSPDFEIPMLQNHQSMKIMQSQPWTSIDEIKPANQKDSLLLQLLTPVIQKKLRDINAV
ncbi:hypothetical protein DPMN_019920 [Dreissena polymorpha]|uniref:Uncharacterized protein n=1 Tax=Dreissena polymorpha TaxID=45954 RepID=A0A9D4S9Q7_DREPO|nr:hypothetical protein DPMN_019920 [Dreissena polymorpha]